MEKCKSIAINVFKNTLAYRRRSGLNSVRFLQVVHALFWRFDIQHNDIQHNDIQHNDIQHNDIQHNDTQLNDIPHNDTQLNDIQHKGLIFNTQNKWHLALQHSELSAMG
jgi:hypothetical protein